MSVFEAIKSLLDRNNIEYKLTQHEPVFTSEQAALVRGVSLASGAKAMVVKSKENNFCLAVISAAEKIDWKKLAEIVKTKKITLATSEEIKNITDCTIGSVPPFGNLIHLETLIDKSLSKQGNINFNPGVHDHSIRMKFDDYFKLSGGKIVEFCRK